MYKYDLFIGHVEEDTTLARNVEEGAKKRGLKTFLAKSDILPSVEWRLVLRKALEESREFAFLVTPRSKRVAHV